MKKLLAALGVALALGVWGAVDITENTVLANDTDWRGQGPVTIAAGATLDLNGHRLQVDALAGAGRITDSKCYQLLEYVQATGQQRVPTGYIPGANTMVEVDFVSENNTNGALYGTKSWSANRFLCMVTNSRLYFFGSGKFITFEERVRYRSIVRNGTMSLLRLADEVMVGNVAAEGTNTDGTELMYFAVSGDTSMQYAGKYRLYGSRVWDSKALRLELVPARNAVTGAVGLLNRVNGTLLTSATATPLVAGAATGATLGIGSLRVAAANGDFLSDFTGTVDSQVRKFVDGSFQLTANADWRALGDCAVDGNVDLNGHHLQLASLGGTGTITDSNEGFEKLEYVECTNQQRILTGITPGPTTAVELEVLFTAQSAAKTCTILGCKSWTSNRYLMFLEPNRNIYFFSGGQIPCQYTTGLRYRMAVTPTTSPNGTFTVFNATTGAQLGSVTVNLTNSDNSQMALFSQSEDLSRAGAFRLYSLKLTKAGTVERNLTPVRNPRTGVAGLWDSVTGKFYVSDSGTPLVAGPVTTPAGTPGQLHVDIPSGVTCVNAGLALQGSLALVKEGTGTLTVMKEAQTYLGGTRITSGEVNIPTGGWTYDFIASNGYLGPADERMGNNVVVESNGVFDFKGNCDYRLYPLVLAGGTLRNDGRDQAVGSGSLGTITLTADSTLDAARHTTFFDVIPISLQLGGYTLTIDTHIDREVFFRNQAYATNGTLSVTGTGDIRVYTGMDARTVALRLGSSLWLDGTLDIGDYYAACMTNLNHGAGAMKVYGRFTPATDYFYGCTLQDGSTLDLNGRTGSWSTTSAFTNGLNRVTFADGATVTVDAHARSVWAGKVVDWGEGNAPENTRFKMDAQSKAQGRNLYVRADGLYATGGVVMIVR